MPRVKAAAGVATTTTRERILDVAMDLFVERGVAGTSISEIERRAGLAGGTGSLYRHFRSKEDVLHAAVEREATRLLSDVEEGRASLPRVKDERRALTQELEQCLHDVRRFERLFRLMLNEGDRIPDLRSTMAKALGFDREDGWSDDLTVVVAVAALGGYHFLGEMQGRPFQGADRSAFIERLADMVSAERSRRGRRRDPTVGTGANVERVAPVGKDNRRARIRRD